MHAEVCSLVSHRLQTGRSVYLFVGWPRLARPGPRHRWVGQCPGRTEADCGTDSRLVLCVSASGNVEGWSAVDRGRTTLVRRDANGSRPVRAGSAGSSRTRRSFMRSLQALGLSRGTSRRLSDTCSASPGRWNYARRAPGISTKARGRNEGSSPRRFGHAFSRSRSSIRRIFPVSVFGSSATNSTLRG